jgi:hypothetical protein
MARRSLMAISLLILRKAKLKACEQFETSF